MAITVNAAAVSKGATLESLRVLELETTLDANYPAGGYDVTDALSAAGAPTLLASIPTLYKVATLAFSAKLVQVGDTIRLQVFDATHTEVAAATDLSAHTVKVQALAI